MNKRGFTLVEMIVSLAIFSVVAVIAIGALLKVIDANKKAQSIQSSVTNVNFAMESMSRDLRTGTDYTADPYCGSGVPLQGTLPASLSSIYPVGGCPISSSVDYIEFNSSRIGTDSNGDTCNLITAYAFMPDLNNSSMTDLGKAEQLSCHDTTYYFTPLISPTDMTITGHELGVIPVIIPPKTYPPSYPAVFIRITGYAGTKTQDQTYVDLETAVSARSQQ